MNRNSLILFYIFLLFFALLLDGQISTLVTNLFPVNFSVSSHLLFMIAIFCTNYLALSHSLLIFTVLGLIYDAYYFGFVGIAVTIFPLCIFVIYYFYKGILIQRLMNTAILLVIIFIFDFLGFLFGRFLAITNLSIYILLVYNLVPSLLFNLLLFCILQPLFEKVFGITNKT